MNICCPLCNAEDKTTVYKQIPQCTSADIVKCSNCGHFYTFLHKEIETDKLYNDEVYKVVENRGSAFDKILKATDHFLDRPKRGVPVGHKKTCQFNTGRLVIENGLSNFYQNPNPFFNAISTILSNP